MKLRTARVFGLAFLLAPTLISLALALNVPPLRGRVNDYAGLMPADRAQALEERLARFESETGHQIALLTVPSLEGDSLEDFSIRVAETWKIGKKGFDNGAILLIARDDRRLRIEVGYGFEGVLPDAIANRIINEVITPRFRSGDYAGGIEAGVDSILKITKGEALPERSRGAAGPHLLSKDEIIRFAKQYDPIPRHIDEQAAATVRDAGATAIGIHVESLDDGVRRRWMPGKSSVPMADYEAAWDEAVRVFGRNRVSTYLLVGLGEDADELIAGAGRLIDRGVYPFVVPFRPMGGTLAARDGVTAPSTDLLAYVTAGVAEKLRAAGMRGADQKAGCAACGACGVLKTAGG